MIHLSACILKTKKDGPWVDCVAVLTAPGLSDVITFILPDGKPFVGECWDYSLWPYKGAISIPTDEDTLP